jgi:acetyltransferase-like isoleucine patch superfamily enzyme/coenzyme F420-reducing hydrogenase beta subunit
MKDNMTNINRPPPPKISFFTEKDCMSCSACFDICGPKSIEMETNNEGLWYPKVDLDTCTDCGWCDKICPELNINELKHNGTTKAPLVMAAYNRDAEVQRESTSGGLFSALANKMYDDGGYVCGAVYSDDFYNVKHIISNKREDLLRIRGSKHSLSDLTGMYRKINKLLRRGEKVLICAAPCQIAGLRLFLRKEYDNLITVDFICLGVNAPRIFQKHLKSLESEFGAKATAVQAKNKDLGWRSLAYKITFANNKVYLKDGRNDNFTRSFLTHSSVMPACYVCKYKGFPRISDISLGDFWGIEETKSQLLDINMGTSVVLLNSQKGINFYNSIKNSVETEVLTLSDALPSNRALYQAAPDPNINRKEFYKAIDTLPFNDVIKEYLPSGERRNMIIIRAIKYLKKQVNLMGLHPKSYIQLVWINILRKNSESKPSKAKLFFPTRFSVIDIHKKAHLKINGTVLFGYKRIKGSRIESRLAIEGEGSFSVERGYVNMYYGIDILIFKGASLTFKGSVTINQNVQIICMDSITFGEGVMISRDVVIRDNDGGHEILTEGYKKTSPVTIGNHVWIGQGAMIMKGVTIGDGAIISAGAWVATNVKPNALVMGDPARTIKKDVDWKV